MLAGMQKYNLGMEQNICVWILTLNFTLQNFNIIHLSNMSAKIAFPCSHKLDL